MFLNGNGHPRDHDSRGQRVVDDTFFLCLSAHHEPIEFTLPAEVQQPTGRWCSTPPSPPPTRRPTSSRSFPVRPSPCSRARWWCCGAWANDPAGAAVPSSTYRLQIRRPVPAARRGRAGRLPAALGVAAIYLSPILQATSGSDHGYDITSHRQVDPERGGEQGRLALAATARELGLQTVVDIVPNHMGVADAAQNLAWWQLLRRGTGLGVRGLVRRRLEGRQRPDQVAGARR